MIYGLVSFTATDNVGLTTVAVSSGVTMDSTPPVTGSLIVGGPIKHRYLMAKKHLSIHWSGFTDPESGIENFYVGFGYQPDVDDVKRFAKVQDQYFDLYRENFQDGRTYYAILKVRSFVLELHLHTKYNMK